VEDHPAVVGGEVVDQTALEFLALEDGTGFVGEFVEVVGDAGAPGVGDGVDAQFDLVDVVEEGVQQRSRQVLVSDLFTHVLILIGRMMIV
jgi:hypothetical protein